MLQIPLRKDVIAFLIPVPVLPPLVPSELFSLILTLNNRWVVCPSDKHPRESLGLIIAGTVIGLFASDTFLSAVKYTIGAANAGLPLLFSVTL